MPQTVAVIGASTNRAKYGNRAVRAFRQRGYTVWPVNPHETTIEGLRQRVGDARIVAVLEPRSNTMKRGLMKESLPASATKRRACAR